MGLLGDQGNFSQDDPVVAREQKRARLAPALYGGQPLLPCAHDLRLGDHIFSSFSKHT